MYLFACLRRLVIKRNVSRTVAVKRKLMASDKRTRENTARTTLQSSLLFFSAVSFSSPSSSVAVRLPTRPKIVTFTIDHGEAIR
jgi:hypothetical protein